MLTKTQFELLEHLSLLDAVEALIGGEIASNPIQHARVKPPERFVSGGAKQGLIKAIPWHQDQAAKTTDADLTEMITAWIPITDSLTHQGCMVVLPRSHTHGLFNHCPCPPALDLGSRVFS